MKCQSSKINYAILIALNTFTHRDLFTQTELADFNCNLLSSHSTHLHFVLRFYFYWFYLRGKKKIKVRKLNWFFVGNKSHLEPSFHLSVCHFEAPRECRTLSRCQIFLLMKPFLQFRNLNSREGCAWLFSLWRRSILIWMSNATWNWKGWRMIRKLWVEFCKILN